MKSIFSILCEDVLIEILSFISDKNDIVHNISLVNKDFNCLSKNKIIWENVYLKGTSEKECEIKLKNLKKFFMKYEIKNLDISQLKYGVIQPSENWKSLEIIKMEKRYQYNEKLKKFNNLKIINKPYKKFHLFITTLSGVSNRFFIDPTNTFFLCAKLLEERLGFPPSNTRLCYLGKICFDGRNFHKNNEFHKKTIKEFNVKNGANIQMIVQLK